MGKKAKVIGIELFRHMPPQCPHCDEYINYSKDVCQECGGWIGPDLPGKRPKMTEEAEIKSVKLHDRSGVTDSCPICGADGCAGAEYTPSDCPDFYEEGEDENEEN